MTHSLFETRYDREQRLAKIGKPNGARCDHCGANCIDACRRCGAPQCCPQCCKIDALETEIKTLRSKLADTPKVRNSDPATSRKAEISNRPRRGSQRWRILKYIYENGSATCDEWEAELNIPHGPRATELKRIELIKPNGKVRATRYNTEAEVLILTEAGKAYIESELEPAK